MEDQYEITLKNICCTCLSRNRKLYQLCRIPNGINNLYLLLSFDIEAYREGFYKDTANVFICWECKAVFRKLSGFRTQVCLAQKRLAYIDNGRDHISTQQSLSNLSKHTPADTQANYKPLDNFIDCGDILEIKDDVLLSKIKMESNHDTLKTEIDFNEASDNLNDVDCNLNDDNDFVNDIDDKCNMDDLLVDDLDGHQNVVVKDDKTVTNSIEIIKNRNEDTFEMIKKGLEIHRNGYKYMEKEVQCKTVLMDEFELLESREKMRVANCFSDAVLQCLPCLEVFKSHVDYEKHNELHEKSPKRTHRVINPGSKPRKNKAMTDKRTPNGFKCLECDKYFDNKNLRYKHIQRYHREGYECGICGKKFPFKDYLAKHVRLHESPKPRTECEICRKMVRTDLLKVHIRIHAERETFSCVECDKNFACRASYENHLKYSQSHATIDVLKYKCSKCDKGYRSKGELRDHFNYQHLGKTQHNCPVCGKALATRRCILRHIRRTHEDIKEGSKDKICQQCGKAFRDKKGLREHEFIHTGERPLSCEICGCTFRQNASLYTHKKRVHKIYPEKKRIELVKPTR